MDLANRQRRKELAGGVQISGVLLWHLWEGSIGKFSASAGNRRFAIRDEREAVNRRFQPTAIYAHRIPTRTPGTDGGFRSGHDQSAVWTSAMPPNRMVRANDFSLSHSMCDEAN
jgi:hypothetical protein